MQSRAACSNARSYTGGVCGIDWELVCRRGQRSQVYGTLGGIDLTGRAEFAQPLLVSGYLLCREALQSPARGHPLVPREQHVFPQSSSSETSQGTLCPSRCWILHSMCSGVFSGDVAGELLELLWWSATSST